MPRRIIQQTTQIRKDILLESLLQEKYNNDICIGKDGMEHYVRLEMNFDEYLESVLSE